MLQATWDVHKYIVAVQLHLSATRLAGKLMIRLGGSQRKLIEQQSICEANFIKVAWEYGRCSTN